MSKAVELDVEGLKCDAEGCDYTDPSIKLCDFHKMIDAPCPKCGANLLTNGDYKATLMIVGLVESMNQEYGEVAEGRPRNLIKVLMNGTGEIKLEEQKQ